MLLANRLAVPDTTRALLWDMDGVLLDTLTFDFEVCNRLLQTHVGPSAMVSHAAIRRFFPYDLPRFWDGLLGVSGVAMTEDRRREWVRTLSAAHEIVRADATYTLNPGVEQILRAAREAGLKLAVVSNNPTADVRGMLGHNGILEWFDAVIGNDIPGVAKKPAPDPYLRGAATLGVRADQCVVIEDSLLGSASGRSAGCYTVGVATGAATFDELDRSPDVDRAYTAFDECVVSFPGGHVTRKDIVTPNDFVSHMVEHIAWRLGTSVIVRWTNADWRALGRAIGDAVNGFARSGTSAAVLGMIDDGSVEVAISTVAGAADAGLTMTGTAQVDVDWFLGLRVEQLQTGAPLLALLEGLSGQLPARVAIQICNLEDPHHTWEGVFRSIGIALGRIVRVPAGQSAAKSSDAPAVAPMQWDVVQQSATRAEVLRRTAETSVRVLMDFTDYQPPQCHFDVAGSIHVDGLTDLLTLFCERAGLRLELDFQATMFSSSHVVMEDVGMVMGRALQQIMVARMNETGINGAGSSLATADDRDLPIHVGLSVEGRKFWTFVPLETSFAELRRDFLVGHTVGSGLFTEDLDDFIDGFSGGLSGSIVVHVRQPVSPQVGWPLVFAALGSAVGEALKPNPARKGVPPGVKATLV